MIPQIMSTPQTCFQSIVVLSDETTNSTFIKREVSVWQARERGFQQYHDYLDWER